MTSRDELPMYRKVWRVLNARERRAAVLQLALVTVGVLLEALGIGLVVPTLMLLTQDDIGSRYPAAQPVLDFVGNPGQRELIVGGMGLLVAVFFVKSVYLAFVAWVQNRFAFAIRVRLSELLFSTYIRQPYAFHLQRNSAMLIRNAQAETTQLVQSGLKPAMVLVAEALLMVAIAALLLAVEPIGMLIVAALLGGAAVSFHLVTRSRIARWGETRRRHDGFRIKHLQQGLGSVKEIKLLGREEEFLSAYSVHNRGSATAARKQATLAQLPRLWLELLAMTGLATLVISMVMQGRDMSAILPVLGVFGAAAFRLLPSFNKVLTSLQTIRYVTAVIDSVYRELHLPVPPPRPGGARGPVDPADAFRREIRAEAVSFVYPGAATPALDGVSFRVDKGETVGFVGPSGSGKSTLIDIMLGLLEPASGRMTVDGEDVQQDPRRWQDQIGYVPQTIYLTDDSLRRNIAFGIPEAEIDDDAIRRAARAAQLEEFIASVPKGLKTRVGERGVRLSGGQRQRIGIARALYHDPPVLVLDEATSALDTDTEREVMAAIHALHGAKTILIVAHRLSTVQASDRIVRLEHGRVAEIGPPDTVLAVDGADAAPSTLAAGARG